MPERFMGEPADDGVSWNTLSTAGPAPPIWFNDTAFDHRLLQGQVLTGGFEAEFVEAAERSQVRARESKVGHVEVFRAERSV